MYFHTQIYIYAKIIKHPNQMTTSKQTFKIWASNVAEDYTGSI